MKRILVGNHWVGERDAVLVIAEAGVNHNQDFELAKRHIIEAAEAGAGAIKFQHYSADTLVTRTAPIYWKLPTGDGTVTQYETFSKLDGLPREREAELVTIARDHGIVWFSTPFDEESADRLDSLGVPVFKIASGDITFLPFIRHVARKKKPILLSTGASTLGEIEEAVEVIRSEGNDDIILLHCTLSYPTPDEDANLLMIKTLCALFPDYPIGLSDHTYGVVAPTVAVALGARVIEKHYTVDKGLPDSPDHKLGVDTEELRLLCEAVRRAQTMLGHEVKAPVPVEQAAREGARRSVVARCSIKAGAIIGREDLICKRPGLGISPKHLDLIVGRKALRDIKADECITWDMV